ncbi:hypothetical protein [Streptomyces sp. Root369]|uniref:hypothetical protein n=1 Tax=Streptomyces sp. Root369 TaxID=1736523 RepID=UPI00070D750A|nr:hypothetical protein [Streptomyces sp. Root369]KQW12937.1 hypothetical protein ASD08_33870 [Streptomyces sp. Root369]
MNPSTRPPCCSRWSPSRPRGRQTFRYIGSCAGVALPIAIATSSTARTSRYASAEPRNAAAPLLAVESLPAARAATGSGAQQTLRYIGSCAGVALTIAIATSSGRLREQ